MRSILFLLLLIASACYADTQYEFEDQDFGGSYTLESDPGSSGGERIMGGGWVDVNVLDPAGTYKIITRYYQENDGSDYYKLFVNDNLTDEWEGGISDSYNMYKTHITDNVDLNRGDIIRIEGTESLTHKSHARLDYLKTESAGPAPPPVPKYEGDIEVSWTQEYKTVPDNDGVIHDIDVLRYRLYQGNGEKFREVPDNDTGAISTIVKFPDDIEVPNGAEWCVKISAVAHDDEANQDVESDKTDPACIMLESEIIEPVSVPVPPSGVTIKATNVGGTVKLELIPTGE